MWRTGEHLQEFYTLYLTRFQTYKIALPPQTKPMRGGGLRQINTPPSPFTGQFLRSIIWSMGKGHELFICLDTYKKYSNLSHPHPLYFYTRSLWRICIVLYFHLHVCIALTQGCPFSQFTPPPPSQHRYRSVCILQVT